MECKFEIELQNDLNKTLEQHSANHAIYGFYLGTEILTAAFYIFILSTNYIVMGFVLSIYFIGMACITYMRFDSLTENAIVYALIYSISAVIFSYFSILNSKTYFLREKIMDQMMNE